MTENLRYGANLDGSVNTDLTDPTKITSNNTDNPATNFSIPIANIATTASNFTSAYDAPKILILDANIENTVDRTYNTTKFGVLYNYCAATAGNACTAEGIAPETDEDGNVLGSICPSSWTLPSYADASTGVPSIKDNDKSFQKLLNGYGIIDMADGYIALASFPLDFIRAGYARGGVLYERNVSGRGNFWSSMQSSDTGAKNLFFSNKAVRRSGNERVNGVSVRCILK